MSTTPLEIFVMVNLAVVGLIIGSYLVINRRISEKATKALKEVRDVEEKLSTELNKIKEECDNMILQVKEQSLLDGKGFSEVLSKINITLGKFQTTLEHFDRTLAGIERRTQEQINELKQDMRNKQDKK